MSTITRYYFPSGTAGGAYSSEPGITQAAPWTTFIGTNSYGARISPPAATPLSAQYLSCSGVTTESNRFFSMCAPAVGAPTSYPGGLFRAAFRTSNWQGTQGTKRLAMMVRHVNAAGVIQGTPVMDMTFSAYVPGSGSKVATVSGVLRAVTLAAGDKLAIEIGANASAPGGGQALYTEFGTPAATPDLPFVDGDTSGGLAWAEMEWVDLAPKIYLGPTKVDKLILGTTDITKAYVGATQF